MQSWTAFPKGVTGSRINEDNLSARPVRPENIPFLKKNMGWRKIRTSEICKEFVHSKQFISTNHKTQASEDNLDWDEDNGAAEIYLEMIQQVQKDQIWFQRVG